MTKQRPKPSQKTQTIAGMALSLVGIVAYTVKAPYATSNALLSGLDFMDTAEQVCYMMGWICTLTGGLLLFFSRLSQRMRDNDSARNRLHGTLMLSSVAITASAYFMLACKGYWLLPILLSAGLELYSSFRIGQPADEKKG